MVGRTGLEPVTPCVAQLLNLGRTNVYGLLGSGQIRSVKLGRRRLVPRESVEEYVSTLGLEEEN